MCIRDRGDAAPSETTVSGAHLCLNVVVQALKTIPAVDAQKVQQRMPLLKKFHRVLEDRRFMSG